MTTPDGLPVIAAPLLADVVAVGLIVGVVVGVLIVVSVVLVGTRAVIFDWRRPRWAHRRYAYALGYFWLPCPVCGEPFGGHEHTTEALFGTTLAMGGYMVCQKPACQAAAAASRRAAGLLERVIAAPWMPLPEPPT